MPMLRDGDSLLVTPEEHELIKGKWEHLIGKPKSARECARIVLPLLTGMSPDDAAKYRICFLSKVDGWNGLPEFLGYDLIAGKYRALAKPMPPHR